MNSKKKIFTMILLLVSLDLFSFDINEPQIQCTVVKVHKYIKAFGFKKFPKLYQSINNNPLNSLLLIAGRKYPKLDPKIINKTKDFEQISISNGKDIIELEILGQPISRHGILKVNGKILANITCH